jgi:phosphatidate cytidylyltransferase
MIKRIITAIVCMALFIGLFILFPKFAIPFLSILISVIASHELIKAFQKVQIKPLKIIIYISCLYTVALFTVYLLSGNSGLDKMLGSENILAGLFLVVFISFLGMILNREHTLKDLTSTLFIVLYVPFLISFVPLINFMDNGKYYIWIVFISVWAVDTFAYFVGSLIGKNHFIERISPKKTLEGFIGGILGGAIGTFLYWLFIKDLNIISLIDILIIGLITGIVAQLGDWTASIIKRQTGIKDFGSLFPGHGGVLDRVDSILMSAPIIYFYLKYIAVK